MLCAFFRLKPPEKDTQCLRLWSSEYLLTGTPFSPGLPGFPAGPGIPGDPGAPCTKIASRSKSIHFTETYSTGLFSASM